MVPREVEVPTLAVTWWLWYRHLIVQSQTHSPGGESGAQTTLVVPAQEQGTAFLGRFWWSIDDSPSRPNWWITGGCPWPEEVDTRYCGSTESRNGISVQYTVSVQYRTPCISDRQPYVDADLLSRRVRHLHVLLSSALC